MKDILVIHYYHPPRGGSGAQRWYYFAKSLSSKERVHVYAVDSLSSKEANPELSIDWRVCRFSGYERAFKMLAKLRLGWLSVSLFRPDTHILWSLRAVYKGVTDKLNGIKYDVVCGTVDPWSIMLSTYLLAKVHGCSYIIDIRDPWTLGLSNKWPTKLHWRLDSCLERFILKRASKVIFVTNSVKELYLKAGYIDSSSAELITNGIGTKYIPRINLKGRDNFNIKIFFFGRLLDPNKSSRSERYAYRIGEIDYSEHSIHKLVEIISRTEIKHNVEVVLAGSIHADNFEILKNYGIKYTYKGYITRGEIVKQAGLSDILFLPMMRHKAYETNYNIAGKFYEYVQLPCHIVYVGQVGDMSQELGKITGTLHLDTAMSYENMASRFEDYMSKIFPHSVVRNIPLKYTREYQSRLLWKILKELM